MLERSYIECKNVMKTIFVLVTFIHKALCIKGRRVMRSTLMHMHALPFYSQKISVSTLVLFYITLRPLFEISMNNKKSCSSHAGEPERINIISARHYYYIPFFLS